jgi:hypothetical protein
MFQMCPDHQDIPMTCYFLKIPMEMRLRIYRLLLPDRPIPARRHGSALREACNGTYLEILRVNHQIHDEATGLLYGTGSFNIEISANGLNMCSKSEPGGMCSYYNGMAPTNYGPPAFPHPGGNPMYFPSPNGPHPGPGGNHALQDYQMQLMLLESQNKRRLMMARQEQDSMSNMGSSSAAPPPVPPSPQHPPMQPFTHYSAPYTPTPSGPVWTCPLSDRYFNQIHHFHITILFPTTTQLNTSYPLLPHIAELRMYDYSDRIHSLIGRLLLLNHPISTLTIKIKFADTYSQRSQAIYASQFLLRPFRRLSNIVKPSVSAIKIMSYQAGPELDILPTLENYSPWPDDANLLAFLSSWTSDLKADFPAMPEGGSKVFDAYWKLADMVKGIQSHYCGVELGYERMVDLLGVARVAREDGDEEAFRGCWEEVVGTWCQFLEEQKQWLRGVEREIDGVYGIFSRDEGVGNGNGNGNGLGLGLGSAGGGKEVVR